MATTIKQLGQTRPAVTTFATLYTAPASTQSLVTIKIAHVAASGTPKYRITNDDNGTAETEAEAIAWDTEISVGSTHTIGGIHMGANQGTIKVRTDTANALTFTAYGVEIT